MIDSGNLSPCKISTMFPLVSPAKPAFGFVTNLLPAAYGYGWTLTSLLGSFLYELEQRYGQRNKEWTLLGIEFSGQIPMIWFPGNNGNVSIMLSESASVNPAQAIYQLAHESVHILSPSGGRIALNVEEGMANAFAREISLRYGLAAHQPMDSYENASELLANLLTTVHCEAICVLRTKKPQIHDWTPEFLQEELPSIKSDLAENLCKPFVRDVR
jgi:hypothetical protein